MKKSILSLALASTLVLSACDSSDSNDTEQFALSLNSVDPLTDGFHYEGWLIIDGAAVPAGKFNVNASGALVDLSGSVISGGEFDVDADVSDATAYVLTIEPAGDSDTSPSSTHYLAGDLSNGSGALSVGHGAALGDSYATSSGQYILATPTNGPNSDENSGIWFLDPTGAAPAATLNLPALPSGWAYEGWSVIDGSPVTTGTFLTPAGLDDFDGFSSTQPGPPFPGEDFLVNAPAGVTFPTDLAGTTAVISIEPSPDNSPMPFTLKPLVGAVPAGAAPAMLYDLGNNAASFPTGQISMQ
jgi:hypothetical protein